MTTTTKPTSLPSRKRYIIGHNEAGKSIILPSPEQVYQGREGGGGIARSYAVSSLPSVLADDANVEAYMEPDPEKSATSHLSRDVLVNNHKGVAIMVVEFPSGRESRIHRTVSIDFSIIVQGNITMELDGGETVHLKPADHVIQRGTMHKW